MVEAQGDQVRIKRDGDTATEVVGGTMPLVLSVTDQSGEARYPSFKGIMAAKGKPVEELKVADLEGLDGIAVTQEITDVTAAEERQAGEIVTDEGDAHERIVQFLEQLKVI